jgi:hypothetical protein
MTLMTPDQHREWAGLCAVLVSTQEIARRKVPRERG